MTAVRKRLSEETQTRLRELARAAEAVDWPSEVARREGWLAANTRYHAAQRAQGTAEMEALLAALGVRPPLPPDLLREVLHTAIATFLDTEGIAAEVESTADGLALNVRRCPIFDRFTEPGWAGVTACGCFARRQGWYDALGIPRDEDLVFNRKWDDPLCRVEIHLPPATG